MKLCITAKGNNLEAEIDPRFGRCTYFIIVDTETLEFKAMENPNEVASGGAGVQSGQLIAGEKVAAVVTGNVGPNAYQTLSSLNVKIYVGASGLVKEAIEAFKQGKLKQAQDSTVPKDSGK
ncbi:MAG: NifB/NifX family molybdenum-iron cluster-binding protein [bacterium]|nr:NifB/NifX family molybdenum-iron cluster-binding protein [Candidatus Margulisiibacteriota bacterium]